MNDDAKESMRKALARVPEIRHGDEWAHVLWHGTSCTVVGTDFEDADRPMLVVDFGDGDRQAIGVGAWSFADVELIERGTGARLWPREGFPTAEPGKTRSEGDGGGEQVVHAAAGAAPGESASPGQVALPLRGAA